MRGKAILLYLIAAVFIAGCNMYSLESNVDSPESAAESAYEPFSSKNASTDLHLEEMVLVSENEFLSLHVNEETTEIAVRVKRTGKIWYSNPKDRELDDVASAVQKTRLGSQLTLVYYDESGIRKEFDNNVSSIQYGQFRMYNRENGIKIVYTIGKADKKYFVPRVISKERFEDLILSELNEEDKRQLLRRFREWSLDNIKDEEQKEDLLESYPILADKDIFVLRSELPDYLMLQLESIVLSTGYNEEDLLFDNQESGVVDESSDEVFVIPLEYYLDGEEFVVTINTDEIEFSEKFPLTSINVLRYFGAANQSIEGYIFVPDGSGALINLNNSSSGQYIVKVYGDDYSFRKTKETTEFHQTYFPVFGMKSDDDAFFTIIEEGDAVAQVLAETSGRVHSYNTVSTAYTILEREVESLSANAFVNVFSPRALDSNIKMRYAFLHGEDANYVGMAKHYQNYLVDRGTLKRINKESDIPFFLEVVGAINTTKPLLGIPVKSTESLTSYRQTIEILEELKQEGIDNIKIRYKGWFNGGVRHSIPTKISLETKLGGEREFQKLLEYVNQNDLELFPDVNFLYVGTTTAFDGFWPRSHSSKLITGQIARNYEFNIADFRPQSSYKYILSPKILPGIVEKFLKKYESYSVGGISLGTMGSDINSDFNSSSFIDRKESAAIIKDQMSKIYSNGINVMVDGGNQGVLQYTRYILNTSLESNQYNITDECIPFNQIVLHGFIDYAGEPINLATDHKKAMLKTLETGSGVYYNWIYEDNAKVKSTDYDYLYSVHYNDWLKEAVDFYQRANLALNDVQDKVIINHEKLDYGVYRTTYEGGKQVMVNYNSDMVSADGQEIGGESFIVIEGDVLE